MVEAEPAFIGIDKILFAGTGFGQEPFQRETVILLQIKESGIVSVNFSDMNQLPVNHWPANARGRGLDAGLGSSLSGARLGR